MKGSALAASLAIAMLAFNAASASAQQPPAQPAPAQPKPAAPPATTPATPPAQTAPAAPAPAAQPPVPFPAGAKIAFINPQRVFQESADGKAGLARVNALIQKKQKEGEDRAKALQANQQKLQTSGGVMNEAARTQLEKEIERQQKEGERFQQDAQAEINELQQEVQNEFLKKVQPILDQVATEKGLHMVLNAAEAGIAWAPQSLDISSDVIKKLDGNAKPATTPKQ
jgi:outer membrane protein